MQYTDSTLDTYEYFKDMGLAEEILHGIHSHGFESPSAIQQKAIVPISRGRDVIAQAQSGTGKTAAFTIGMLQRIHSAQASSDSNTPSSKIQAIILAPTRELAQQIQGVVQSLASQTSITTHSFIGGTKVMDDRAVLREGVQVMIGTPGRIKQMTITDPDNPRPFKPADLSSLKMIIIDEADEMLSKGFQESVSQIYSKCPLSAQVVLISATYNDEVKELATQVTKDPVQILVKSEELTLEGIQQTCVQIKEEEKLELLKTILQSFCVQTGIIYVDTVENCKKVFTALTEEKMPVGVMHSNLEQSERNKTMNHFKNGNLRYIVATDLMARGIDIQALGIVINYNLPNDNANYLHRVGRAGRYGKKGLTINFLSGEADIERMKEIEKHYGTKVEELNQKVVQEWSTGGD